MGIFHKIVRVHPKNKEKIDIEKFHVAIDRKRKISNPISLFFFIQDYEYTNPPRK